MSAASAFFCARGREVLKTRARKDQYLAVTRVGTRSCLNAALFKRLAEDAWSNLLAFGFF